MFNLLEHAVEALHHITKVVLAQERVNAFLQAAGRTTHARYFRKHDGSNHH